MKLRVVMASAMALAGTVVLTQAPPGVSAVAAADLFISEYVEGSSNNKAIEIYNGTGAPVDLAAGGYELELYFNGSTSVNNPTIDLSGTLADGDVFVVADDGADAAVLAVADLTPTRSFFNGDDAVVLRSSAGIVDVIGQVGTDPGSEWGTGDQSTRDNTLRRSVVVCEGDTDGSDAFDPAAEWDGFPQNTFDGLGAHACSGDIVITEVMQNPSIVVDSVGEWFEVKNISGSDVDIDGWTISDDNSDSHTIANGGPLIVPTGGYLVLGNNASSGINGGVSIDYEYGSDINLDDGDDEIVLADPSTGEVDRIEYDGGSSWPDPFGASMSLDPGATDTVSNDDGANWCEATSEFGVDGLGTPGAANDTCPPPTGVCGDTADFIRDVRTLSDGTDVVIEGVVVGDFQDDFGTDGDLNGFFVQEEDVEADADPTTSEGIFVFQGSDPDVDVAKGDVVRVAGLKDEFRDNTQVDTVARVDICASGVSVTPTVLTLPVVSIDDFEAVEGMSVVAGVSQDLYISEYFNFDRFGEIVLTTERQYQPTARFDPGSGDAAALADLNDRSRITLDDGRTGSNPDPARHPNGDPFVYDGAGGAPDNIFRGGDILNDVAGVVQFSFDLYRIQPTAGATYVPDNPRPVEPDDVGGSVHVAAFNVLNYFHTIDDGQNDICGAAQTLGCRGADDAEERDRQLAKIVSAMSVLDADVVGIIEVENTPGVEAMDDIVGGLNAEAGFTKYDYIDTGVIGTDAIKVGLVYQPAVVSPSGPYAVLDDPAFVNPFGADRDRNRPALAQTFTENASGAKFTVAVNHLKSKGSGCGEGDDDPEAGGCNLTRAVAAQVLADWLAGDPTGSGDPDVMIIGDLNSYDQEDPIDQLKSDGYTDLLDSFGGPDAYTYVFNGELGHLDYAMSGATLTPQVTGTTAWNINADEADILDYDTTFKLDAQDAIYAPDPFRSSDHDPVLVGLDLNVAPVCSAATPSVGEIWPPNDEFVDVEILGVTDVEGDDVTITIDAIAQDEPVAGGGPKGPDAAGVGTDTAQIRAQRNGGGDGRIYEILFTATDEAGQRCSGSVVVTVPKSQNGQPAVDSGDRFDSTVG